jgi:uracil-DNA glycosylase family 4
MQRAYSALVLTEGSPPEIRTCIWGEQATADLLANTEDLRYSFKHSSLACPFCGEILDGEAETTGEKKKPWEIGVKNLHHETPNPGCPSEAWRQSPRGAIIEKLLICHAITQCAMAEGKGDSLHNDPSIPKLHANFEGDDLEMLKDLCGGGKHELFASGGDQSEIPSGQVQRAFPARPLSDKTEGLEEAIRALPQWRDNHPEDPDAPKISGWITVPKEKKTEEKPMGKGKARANSEENGENEPQSENGEVALCGYILPGEEPGDLPETYGIPIFEIHGPEALTGPTRGAIAAYAEASIQCAPPNEPFAWREAATVKRLKKEEKNRRKKKIQDEIDRLPKEQIWEGFKNVSETDLAPNFEETGEPPQFLTGYRPGGDPKKWWLPGIGNPHAKVWVLGLYPSTEEIKRKAGPKILAGASGHELFRLIREAGLDPAKDVFFENLIKRYMPPKSKLSAEIKMEQTWLLRRQLAHFKPERMICLGAEAFKELVGDKSFQNFRGTWLDAHYPRDARLFEEGKWTGRTAGTFHPAGVLRPEGRHNLELFRHDFKELLLDSEKENVEPKWREIRTIEEAEAWLEKEMRELDARGQDCIYTVDTEGLSLNVDEDELLCIQIARVFGTYDPKSKWLVAEDIPRHVDLFVLRQNSTPEHYDAESFEDPEAKAQLSLFAEEVAAEGPKAPGKPVFAVANNEEERREIIATHGKKRKGRSLDIFTPYRRKMVLGTHEPELGEMFNTLSLHKRCVGFAATNANHDRVRLERFLGWDLTMAAKRRGLPYPLDTMLAEHVLDENGDLGLKACLNKHFNWPRQDMALDKYAEDHNLAGIKDQITNPAHRSAWSLYPWDILRPYAAKDAYGCAALLAKQLKEISEQVIEHQSDRIRANNPNTLESAFHISCGAINGTYEMHKMGMPIGESGMEVLRELTSFYAGYEASMIEEYQDSVFRLTGLRNANPASPEELSYVLFNPNSPLRKQGIEPWKESGRNGRLWTEIPKEEQGHCTASTDAESLEIIASNCENPELQKFLLRLSETKTILTIRSSFLADQYDEKGRLAGKGLIGRINPKSLCMHTTYTPTLDTNRCRSVPNLSTFPKDETEMVRKILGVPPPHKIREIVQAPPGCYLLNRDWTTAEVLGLGYLSQDQNMLSIVARMGDGMDFHCKLAVQTYAKIRDAFSRIEGDKTPDVAWIEATFDLKQAKGVKGLWANAWSSEGWGNLADREQGYGLGEKTARSCWDGNQPKFTEEAIHKITKKLFKQERTNIKPVTFGVPYGREAPAIMKQLNREYYVSDIRDASGKLVTVSKEEAQAMIDSYKTGFSSAWAYLVAQAEEAKTKGILRDHWGYIRHFPQGMSTGDVTRKAYNYQVQHIVAVLMNHAMNDWVQERAKRELKSYAYATLYDNIGWVVHEDELQEVWDLSMEVMTAKRPAGPKEGELPILHDWHIPTEGELSLKWEGPDIDPKSLGITLHEELNRTGLEGLTW